MYKFCKDAIYNEKLIVYLITETLLLLETCYY